MPAHVKARPRFGEFLAKAFHRRVPFFVAQSARPNPRDAKRRLAPPFGGGSGCIANRHPHAGARDIGDRLPAKLQRHTSVNGQKIKHGANGANISG